MLVENGGRYEPNGFHWEISVLKNEVWKYYFTGIFFRRGRLKIGFFCNNPFNFIIVDDS